MFKGIIVFFALINGHVEEGVTFNSPPAGYETKAACEDAAAKVVELTTPKVVEFFKANEATIDHVTTECSEMTEEEKPGLRV